MTCLAQCLADGGAGALATDTELSLKLANSIIVIYTSTLECLRTIKDFFALSRCYPVHFDLRLDECYLGWCYECRFTEPERGLGFTGHAFFE